VVEVRPVKRDENAYARMGWLLVLFGFGGALLWAAFAPLDQGVAVSATVIISGQRKSVQHPLGGVVKSILVRDGQQVAAGDPLIRMEPVQAQASVDSLSKQYASARFNQARLQAEYDARTTLEIPPGLQEQIPTLPLSELLELQRQLLHSRQAALANELSGLRANIQGQRAQLAGLRLTEQSQQQQQQLLNSQLSGSRDLSEEGYMPRNQMLEQERQLAQVNALLSESRGRMGLLQQSITEAQLRISQRQEEYRKEVSGQLADAQVNASSRWEELTSARYALQLSEVRAPVSGYVAGLRVFTDGGVINPGELLMYVVPNSDSLEVEGQLAVNLIDKVHSGLPVEMLFTAFNQSKTPRVSGEVTMVSADRLLDEQTRQPYYSLRAQVDAQGMGKLAGERIRPGMPVQVFIRTGERSLLNYLFKPLFDRAHLALTES
jgi:protease secretion system membrane fusion protein